MNKCVCGVCFFLVFSCLSCSVLFGPPEFEIDATKCTDFSDLVTFELEEYGNNIVGIDTTDFTLRGHIRYDKDRSVGGVVNTPDGRVIFSGGGRISTHTWGDKLYVVDSDCNIEQKVSIYINPLKPVLAGNYIIVGSAAYEEGGTFPCQIIDVNNYEIVKKISVDDMAHRTHITKIGSYVYIGNWVRNGQGYIIKLNLKTLETERIKPVHSFFNCASIRITGNDTTLYITNIPLEVKRMGYIGVFNLRNNEMDTVIDLEKYDEIKEKSFERIDHPKLFNGYLYVRLSKDTDAGRFVSYFAILDPKDMSLDKFEKIIDVTAIDFFPYTSEYMQFYAGRYFVVQLVSQESAVVKFFEIENLDNVHEVVFDSSYGYN